MTDPSNSVPVKFCAVAGALAIAIGFAALTIPASQTASAKVLVGKFGSDQDLTFASTTKKKKKKKKTRRGSYYN